MHFLIGNLELISGKNIVDKSSADFVSEVSDSAVFQKNKIYSDKIDGSYHLFCNFKKGTGPVVLNKYFKDIYNLVDGKKTARDIYKIVCEKNGNMAFGDIKNLVYLVGKSALTPGLLFKNFRGIPMFNFAGLKKALVLLAAAGLIDSSDTKKKFVIGNTGSLSVWMHLSGRCNLACEYCYVKKNTEEMGEELGKKIIDKLIYTAQANGIKRALIKFAGGEPFLMLPLLFNLSDYAIEKFKAAGVELRIACLTNGTMVTKTAIDELKKRDIKLVISLDGVGKWHDLQAKYANGRGSFEDVDRSINLLIRENWRPSFISVISAANLGGFVELAKYFEKKKLYTVVNFIRKNEDVSEKLLPNHDKLIVAVREIFKILEKNLPRYYSVPSNYSNRVPAFDASLRFWCGVGSNYLIFQEDGTLVPCVMSLGDGGSVIGHVDDADNLLGFIQKPEVQKMNPLLKDKKECLDCMYLNACKGGCPKNNYHMSGDYTARSSYCEVYKALAPEAMRLAGKILIKNYRT